MRLINRLINQANSHPQSDRLTDSVIYISRFVLLAVVYCLIARFSIQFTILAGIASPLWPPAAVALCACLVWGIRMAPAIWLGATLGTLTAGQSLLPASVIGIGSTLEACTAALLIQHTYHARTGLIYQGDVSRFMGIALLASMIGASLGIAALF